MKLLSNQNSKVAKKGGKLQDPHFERESRNYEKPLPSRELVLQLLEEQGAPISDEKLIKLLGLSEDDADIFSRRLRAMERDGQIMRNRKNAICLMEKLHLIKGTVQGHADGFGFLVPDDKSPDLFLSGKQMDKVLHGDRVMARQIGVDRRGRPEASIVEVLEHVNNKLVGRLHVEHGILFVTAENKRISQEILIEPGSDKGAQPGQVVMVDLVEQPSKHNRPIGRVAEVLGNYADPGMEIEIALRKHNLPNEFPVEVAQAAKKIKPKVQKKDHEGREDIRDLPLVTIDGETARDFDDAVFCKPLGKGWKLIGKGGWKLYVAIADVSHYVKPGEPLDKEAIERGNSVYFPRRVIPMLPEELSNGLCSINPDVERLCMVCEMDINSTGVVKKYRFYPAVMKSHKRFTYTTVAEMLADPKGKAARENEALLPHILELEKLFRVLVKARAKRGAIDFETIETQMIFNDQGKIDRIVPVHRNDAHRVIEECMLAANVCASEFLKTHKHPALYRIHEGPTPEKLINLREFLADFGLDLGGGDDPHAKDYAKLLEKIKNRPDAQLLQTVMLRSLRQAVYSPDNVGHFGLAYENYTHFTSPIRRYPDLLVHRSIKAALQGEKYKPGKWDELGMHCSMTERRADEATRDVDNWLKCYFMQDKVGEVFTGSISGVTGFGVFVALDDIYAEGLVHVTDLGDEYFHFDAARHQMLGERTGKRYRLGDRLQVKVMRVDLETSKVDFALVKEEQRLPDMAPTKTRAAKPRAAKPQPAGARRKPKARTGRE
ncbi:MAG: ribonuclease R [Sulfuricella denitrificans]|nr:ribonuclease R [Sulfuricella denitrificans]